METSLVQGLSPLPLESSSATSKESARSASSSPQNNAERRQSRFSLASISSTPKSSADRRQSRLSTGSNSSSPSKSFDRRLSNFSSFVTSCLLGQNEERKRKASLDYDEYIEYTADINANKMDIHQSHIDLPPHMWGVSLQDLNLFESEVRKALELGIIENYDPSHAEHNLHHLDPTIGPNIYQVNEHYIKPVTWRNGGMSFALMMNPTGLKCDVFSTHAWREGVFEFGDKCRRAWPRNARSLWCCFLANPQNGDISKLLSGSVFESPFAKALGYASYMVVLPNHDCSIYTRLWCVLEAKLAIECDVDLVLLERISKRNTFIALIPTIVVGVLVYAYTLLMCYLFYLHNFGVAVAFVACICGPMIVAGGVYYWSQGRFVRLEIHARMMILACISAILFSLLWNSEEFLQLLFEEEINDFEEERCRFREVLNTTTDTVIIVNIIFIAVATTYKQAERRGGKEGEQSFDSTGDGDDSDSSAEGDENSDVARVSSGSFSPPRDHGRTLGHIFILWGEILFFVWFFLELTVRIIGSYSVCPMLSLGNFVLELVFNTLSVVDIYLMCRARRGVDSKGYRCKSALACFTCCGAVSAFVAFASKMAPLLSRVTKIRRLIRLLKLLRLARLVRLLKIPQTWWLCCGLVATFFIIGAWTILESALQEELKVSSAQLDFTSVRHATCSNAGDQKRLFDAIKGNEDEIDGAINILRSAGKFDGDVRRMLDLGLTVSRKNLRYNIHKAVHTGILWGIFCVSGARDSIWWLACVYPLISIALAAYRRPSACRLNFAVLSWRRPVWAGMVFSILFEVLGVSNGDMLYLTKYATRLWGIAASAMGPSAAIYIHHRLIRDPYQYEAPDWLLLFCIGIVVITSMSCCFFFFHREFACMVSKLGSIPTDLGHVSFGGKDWSNVKTCSYGWLASYHVFLVAFGLFWTVCGICFERRIQQRSGGWGSNQNILPVEDGKDNTSRVDIATKTDSMYGQCNKEGTDSAAPLQWVELTERRMSHP